MVNRMRPLGVAVLAGAGLLLEIALTRIFSTLYYPPYVFVVLSLAVLGIGLGAGLIAWRSRYAAEEMLYAYATAAGTFTLLLLVLLLARPEAGGGLFQYILLVLPFFALGMILATLFALNPDASPVLYRADLLGAGAGALLAVPLLDALGGINGALTAAFLFYLAGLLLGGQMNLRRSTLSSAVGVLLLVNLWSPLLTLNWERAPTDKPLLETLAGGGEIVASRWDAFARTDLVDPGDGRPWELYTDGGAGSIMPPRDGDPALWRDIGFFPFATEQPARVFIIGPGGGADIWFAQQGRAEEIVAVEVNSAAVDLMIGFGSHNGHLAADPILRLEIGEGRHLLERENARYDLIFLSHVLTLATERTGFALVENRALTVEAFAAYLNHLAPDGQLALKLYDEATLTRALATVLAVLRAQGMDDAAALQQIMVLVDNNDSAGVPLLLVRAAPFSRDDSLSLGAVAREVGFTPLFLPGVLAGPPLDRVVDGTQSFAQILSRSDQNLLPTTDDRPFFYLFERGLPQELGRLFWILLPVVLAGAAFILAQARRLPVGARHAWAPPYFAALGAGFMLVEIAVIQQTQQLLSHPTQALSVVLATLLVAGGLGSGVFGRRFGRVQMWIPMAIAAAVLLWLLLWPRLVPVLIATPQPLQLTATIVLLAPPAFLMGAPFPLGLRTVGATHSRHVALGWSVNGVMSVAGSVLGIALAVLFGYRSVLLAGAVLYVLAGLIAPKVDR